MTKQYSKQYIFYVTSLIFLTYGIFGISWSATGALMADIIKELNISVAQASFLSTAITIAKILGALISGIIVSKLGLKRAFAIGGFLISLGVLSALAKSFIMLLALRFFMGLGSAICLVCLVPLVKEWVSSERQQLVNGVNGISNILGTIVALLLTPFLSLMLGGWKLTLSFYGFLSLIIAILWVFIDNKDLSLESQEKQGDKEHNSISFLEVLKNPISWGMFLYYMFPVLAITISFTYFPIYFQQYAQSTSWMVRNTGLIVNIGFMVGIIVSTVFRKKLPFAILITALTKMFIFYAILLFIKSTFWIPFLAFLAPLAIGFVFGRFISIPNLLPLTPKKTSAIMGLFWCLTYIMVTINVWIMGKIVDYTGAFTIAFIYFCLTFIPGIVGYIILNRTLKKLNLH